MVHVLPDGRVGMRGHRLVEAGVRQRGHHLEHFIAGKPHGPPAIERRLGEGRDAKHLHLGLNLGQRIMRLLFIHKRYYP